MANKSKEAKRQALKDIAEDLSSHNKSVIKTSKKQLRLYKITLIEEWRL